MRPHPRSWKYKKYLPVIQGTNLQYEVAGGSFCRFLRHEGNYSCFSLYSLREILTGSEILWKIVVSSKIKFSPKKCFLWFWKGQKSIEVNQLVYQTSRFVMKTCISTLLKIIAKLWKFTDKLLEHDCRLCCDKNQIFHTIFTTFMLFWVRAASLPSCICFQEYFLKSLEVKAIKQTDWRVSGLIMSCSTSFKGKIEKKR